MKKLSKKTLHLLKENLLVEKDALLKKIEPSEIDVSGDDVDLIQGNIILDMEMQVHDLNNKKLASIEEALRRMEESNYGICADCEEPISEKRLLAYPCSITCISCAETRELEEKRSKLL